MDRVFLLTPMTVIDELMVEGFLALGAGKTKVTSVQDMGHHRGSFRNAFAAALAREKSSRGRSARANDQVAGRGDD